MWLSPVPRIPGTTPGALQGEKHFHVFPFATFSRASAAVRAVIRVAGIICQVGVVWEN
jgi:hypothetical protein